MSSRPQTNRRVLAKALSVWAAVIAVFLLGTCAPPAPYSGLPEIRLPQATALPQPTETSLPGDAVPLTTPTSLSRPRTPSLTSTPVPLAGELHLAVREDIKTLNPLLAANPSEDLLVSLLYDTLLDEDARGNLKPNLAERWQSSSAGTVLTCWLHPGARWHDGSQLTAEDVVFSLNLIRDRAPAGFARLAALLDRVEAVSPSQVKITLLNAHVDTLYLLMTRVKILPVTIWGQVEDPLAYDNLDKPIGSGPFRCVEFVAQKRVVLETFRPLEPDLQGPAQGRETETHHSTRPSLQRLVVEIVRDEVKALQSLQEDKVDLLGWDVEPSLARDVLDHPDRHAGIKVAEASGSAMHTLLLNLRQPPYDILAFRQALAQALDTEAIIASVCMGLGDEATPGLVPPASSWQNKGIPAIPFDLQAAMTRLDAIGFHDKDGDGYRENPDGSRLRISIVCPDVATSVLLAEAVAGSWQALGLTTQVSKTAQAAWLPTVMQGQFSVAVHSLSWNEPEMAFFYFHTSRGLLRNGRASGLNYGGYANPEYDELASALLKEPDKSRQQQWLYRLQEILAADLPQIPLYAPRVLNLYRDDRFTNWSPQPGQGLVSRAVIVNLRARPQTSS